MIRIIPTVDAAVVINAADTDIYPKHINALPCCVRVVLNHPFVDGNERTGFLLMLEAAATNGVAIEFSGQHPTPVPPIVRTAGRA